MPTRSRDALSATRKIWEEIDELRRQIKAAEERVDLELRRLARNKHRAGTLWEMYWNEEDRVSLTRLSKLFRVEVRDLATQAGPARIPTTCLLCEKGFNVTAGSKAAYKELTSEKGVNPKHRICPRCAKVREADLQSLRKKKGRRLTEADRKRYHAYLRTDQWQERRRRALVRAKHKCQLCSSKFTLQAHHRSYERIGQEKPEDLIVLCSRCHEKHHDH